MPKSEDSFKMILTLKRLNGNMPYIFILKWRQNLFWPSWNLLHGKSRHKGYYYSVSILLEHQKYLKSFAYQFTSLPNGLCSDPRKFTKLILKPPLSYFRLRQLTAAGFIVDLVAFGGSFIEYERNVKLTVTLQDVSRVCDSPR